MWTWKKKRGKTHRFMAPCPVGTSSHWTSCWGVPSLRHGAAQAMRPEWLCPDGPSWAHCEFQDNSEKTAASERGDFYITGDWAHIDKDGYFWFMGRNNDVSNSLRSSCLLFPSPFEASWERRGHLEEFVFLLQLPAWTRWSGECTCWAPSHPGVRCGQQAAWTPSEGR